MIHWKDWSARHRPHEHNWLVLGKGPTSDLLPQFDLSGFRICALNHAGREVTCEVSHVIDIDVLKACGDAIVSNARWLVMPRVPHLRSRPSRLRLEHFFDAIPSLAAADAEERLIWYDLDTSRPVGPPPSLHAGAFSVETAFELLANCGVRSISTLGIDGGKAYSSRFADLRGKTLLANGQAAFDAQFDGLTRICTKYGVRQMAMAEVMRVFIGCDDTQVIPAQVLQHSIKRHATWPVEFFLMRNMPFKQPQHSQNRAGTAFSFNRFLIPELAGYRGRALYVDADMLVFADVRELWELAWEGSDVLCTDQQRLPSEWVGGSTHFRPGRQMSVMLLNCDALRWDIRDIIQGLDRRRYSYSALMDDMCIVPPERVSAKIPPEWNCLEWFEQGITKLLHYTVVPTQPWKRAGNPNEGVWLDAFRLACREGAISRAEVENAVKKGFCRRILLDIIGQEGGCKPESHCRGDKPFALAPTAIEANVEAQRLRESLWAVLGALHEAQNRIRELETPLVKKLYASCVRLTHRLGCQPILAFVNRLIGRGR